MWQTIDVRLKNKKNVANFMTHKNKNAGKKKNGAGKKKKIKAEFY